MNRNERRRLAKQQKKKGRNQPSGTTAAISQQVIAVLEQAIDHQTNGRLKEAEILYRQVLQRDPENPFANHFLGVIVLGDGNPLEAANLIGKALTENPDNPEMLHNLGNAWIASGQFSKAEEAYGKALEIKPENFVALGNRGIALHFLERIEEAKESYRRALEISPNYVDALKNLANALMSEGALQEATEVYDRAISLDPGDTGMRVNRAMILPVIPTTVAEILHYRAVLMENLNTLIAAGGSLQDPATETGVTGFYLAYHGMNNVPVVEKISEMYRTLCPRLTWTADHCRIAPVVNAGGKYRIGFLSHHFHNHTIAKLNRGFIDHFDRNRFEVIVFRTGTISDKMSQAIEAVADKTIHLPENLEVAQQMVAQEKLDLLFYPDTGMDAFTYYLAYARLAPVQVTAFGHPVTTGITNMDYFISSDDLETATGDDHYSETLVRLKHPCTYYYRPKKPEKIASRSDFGLPEDANLYLCPQTLFKFHPDYDAVLGAILEADPQGRLVIISGRYPNKQKLLVQRFAAAFPDHVGRVQFVPRMPLEKFLQLILNADVLLDPMFFGGGNTSIEAFALAAPIVTLAGDYLRDRVTYSFYKTMGFEDLIASDVDDYVKKAVRVATDKGYRRETSEKLDQHSDRFFENMEIVRELERFFIAAIDARRKNEPAINWTSLKDDDL